MNVRQGALLHDLINARTFLTCDQLARRLDCSEKTVRTDAKTIESFLRREGFSSRIESRRGVGLRLVVEPGEKNRLMRCLGESEVAMRPRLERLCHEMITVACLPGAHTVASLAKRLYTNKQQIQSDLRWWHDVLSQRGIVLRTGRSVGLEGSEWSVRMLLMSLMLSFSRSTAERSLEPALTGGCQHDREFYKRCIDRAQATLGFSPSSNARWQLIVYLKIMVARMKVGQTVVGSAGAGSLLPFFADLRQRLEAHFSLAVPVAEMQVLQDILLCCTWQWNDRLIREYAPSERAVSIAQDIAQAMGEQFGMPMPSSYEKPLSILVESGLARRACGLVVPNPSEETVKFGAMEGFCLIARTLSQVPSLVEASVHSSDFSRLALVLLDYLESADCQRQYRAGLVVNCGIELVHYGRRRIERFVPRVRVAGIVTEDEVVRSCAVSRDALFDRFDFLVSFDPIDVAFPCVVISKAIDGRDIDRIVSSIPLWRAGRETDVPWRECCLGRAGGVLHDEEVARGIFEDLTAQGMLSMSLERFCWLFESLSFVRSDGVFVLPLYLDEARRTGVVLYRLEGRARVRGRTCRVAAVAVISSEDCGNLVPVTESFKRIIADHAVSSEPLDEGDFLVY